VRFPQVDRKTLPSLWVLVDNVLTRATSGMFVVSMIVWKGRSIVLILHELCVEGFNWRLPSLKRGYSVPANRGSSER